MIVGGCCSWITVVAVRSVAVVAVELSAAVVAV